MYIYLQSNPLGMGTGMEFCPLTLVGRVRTGDVGHLVGYGFALPMPAIPINYRVKLIMHEVTVGINMDH